MNKLATLALVAGAGVAHALDASPAFFFPYQPGNGARDLEARQGTYCPSGYGKCNGYETCAPFDAQCCVGGSYCRAGTRCVTDGCCPVGKICSSGGGTITEDSGTYTEYSTEYSTSTSTSSRATTTSLSGDATPFTPYGTPRVVKVTTTTTYYEVDLYYEASYVGVWYEEQGCASKQKVKRCDGYGGKSMSVEFDSSVVGFAVSVGILGVGDITVTAGGVAQNISILDSSVLDEKCQLNYWFEFEASWTEKRTVTLEYFPGSFSGPKESDYVLINQVLAYGDSSVLHSASTTKPGDEPSTIGAGTTGYGGGGAAMTSGGSPPAASAIGSGGAVGLNDTIPGDGPPNAAPGGVGAAGGMAMSAATGTFANAASVAMFAAAALVAIHA